MGLDARIFFSTNAHPKTIAPLLPRDYRLDICPHVWEAPMQATAPVYEVDTNWRFYGVGYERGPWEQIREVLMILLTHKDVKEVWYCSDSDDYTALHPLTRVEFSAVDKHYDRVENEPYRAAFRKVLSK